MLTKAHIRFINDLRQKKAARDEHGMFVAEGPKVVEELLRAENVGADEVYGTDEWLAENYDLAQEGSRFVMEVNEGELARISGLKTPNQVLGIFYKPAFEWRAPGGAAEEGVTLLLDGIQDPGNLGTMIRTADWFGVRRVVCSLTCADAFGPKVVQSTMGSLARVEVEYVDLVAYVAEHKDVPLYVATMDGESVFGMGPVKRGFLLIGNEGKGVGAELVERATKCVSVPRRGGAESLNAAVAAGILMAELGGGG